MKFTFEVPDQVVPDSNMAKKPAPTGFAHVKLHNTDEIPDGIVCPPNVPVTATDRELLPEVNGPPLVRESYTRIGGFTDTNGADPAVPTATQVASVPVPPPVQ